LIRTEKEKDCELMQQFNQIFKSVLKVCC